MGNRNDEGGVPDFEIVICHNAEELGIRRIVHCDGSKLLTQMMKGQKVVNEGVRSVVSLLGELARDPSSYILDQRKRYGPSCRLRQVKIVLRLSDERSHDG